tara:strand:- start:3287 stop:4444 length:1158 start_codon:yes stop_codon:yes gene_type:complete
MDEETLYTYKESIKETIYGEINSYTSKKYDIVHNIISNKYLIKLKNKTHWEELNLSSLKIELIAAGIKTSKDVLETFMSSHLVGKINPLEMFFKDLDEWDGKDHIGDLASYVPTDDDELFNYHLKKWLVRAVKCAIEPDYFNKNCLVLVQEMQNSGKTTFCRFIVPPKLKNYTSENIKDGKDSKILLTTNFIINLDEIDTIESRVIRSYKSFFSATWFNLRLPYGKVFMNFSRVCSFIGSTNLLTFLKRDTGSVRWICFEIIGKINFDYSKNIDINKVWAQAYHLAYSDKQFNSELTQDDVLNNEERNERHFEVSVEEELVSEYYEKSKNRTDFLTTTQITNYIKTKSSYVNPISIGKALRSLGYKRINGLENGHKGYMIRLKKK